MVLSETTLAELVNQATQSGLLRRTHNDLASAHRSAHREHSDLATTAGETEADIKCFLRSLGYNLSELFPDVPREDAA